MQPKLKEHQAAIVNGKNLHIDGGAHAGANR